MRPHGSLRATLEQHEADDAAPAHDRQASDLIGPIRQATLDRLFNGAGVLDLLRRDVQPQDGRLLGGRKQLPAFE